MSFEKQPQILNVDFDCSTCKKSAGATGRIPVSRVIEKLDSFFDKNDLSGAENLLEYWRSEAFNMGDTSGELSVVNEMLGLFRKTNNPKKAAEAVDRALYLISVNQMDSSVSGATIMLNAATTCKAFQNIEKGIPLYKKAEKIYKKELPQDDLRLAAFYNNYATALTDIKEFDQALDLYQKAIAITGKSAEGLLDCAVSYVNLAHLYQDKEGYESEKIEECLKKAKNILKDESIKRDSYYAFVSEKCAPSFDYFGYFLFAKQLLEKSREIYERA